MYEVPEKEGVPDSEGPGKGQHTGIERTPLLS